MARTGRRAGTTSTRSQILDAAKRRFAADGYSGASIRAIAAEAGVDAALIHHYFGTKSQLFVTCMELPLNPGEVVPALLAEDPATVGARLVRTFLAVWDDPAGRERLSGLVRSAVTNEQAARMLREFIVSNVLHPVAERLGQRDAELRAALVGSQMVGFAFLRYVIGVEPLASADHDTIEAALAPVVQRYLTGDITSPD